MTYSEQYDIYTCDWCSGTIKSKTVYDEHGQKFKNREIAAKHEFHLCRSCVKSEGGI